MLLTNVVAPDKLGGLERYVRELAIALCAQGAEVTVVAKTAGNASPGTERVDARLTLVRYRPPSKRNPLFALLYPVRVSRAVRIAMRNAGASRRALRAGDVVVHGHFPIPMIPALLARVPFVYTMHAPVFKELLGERQGTYVLPASVQRIAVGVLARLEATIVRHARSVVTLSDFVAAEAESLAGRPLETVRIAGGIDLHRFSPGSSAQPEGDPVLFSARRFVERTGVELLVEAMPAILHALPGAQLHIAGDGPRRAAIERRIGELELVGRVHLLGRVSDDELVSWYRSADLCITPTLYLEGFGLSTAEAMACGSLAVVTPTGANPELVEPVHPALVAADVSSAALAEAVVAAQRLVGDASVAQRSLDSIVPRMGWEAVAARHVALYATVATRAKSRRGSN